MVSNRILLPAICPCYLSTDLRKGKCQNDIFELKLSKHGKSMDIAEQVPLPCCNRIFRWSFPMIITRMSSPSSSGVRAGCASPFLYKCQTMVE